MLIAAAVFMAMFGVIYFLWKENGGRKPLVFKALATFMPVLLALYYAWSSKESFSWWILAGTLFYMAADVLLEIWFLTGVLSFGIGHVCVMVGLVGRGVVFWHIIISFIFLMGFMFLMIRKYVRKLEKLLVPGVLYAGLLCLMAAMAVSAGIQTHSISGVLLGAGGICFVISDTILVWCYLGGKSARSYNAALLVLYYAAVYFLVSAGLGSV